jgi:hypothetical protein
VIGYECKRSTCWGNEREMAGMGNRTKYDNLIKKKENFFFLSLKHSMGAWWWVTGSL